MQKTLKNSRKPLALPQGKEKDQDQGDMYELMDLEDEVQIRDELLGRYVDEYVYTIKVETRKGPVMLSGLSYAGTKELVKEVNVRGKARYTATDIPPIVEEHDTYWLAKIQCEDTVTGLKIWGVKKQSKRKANGKIDEHAEAIAVSKAQRNGLQGLLPKGMVNSFIREYLKKKGAVKEIKTKEPPPQKEIKEPEKVDTRDIWGRTINNLARDLAITARVKKEVIVLEAVGDKTDKEKLTECSIDELKKIALYLEKELAKYKSPKKPVEKPSEVIEESYNGTPGN